MNSETNSTSSQPSSDEANICALCQHNRQVMVSTYCDHPLQKDKGLLKSTHYNDSCKLFEEADHRKSMYDSPIPQEKYSCSCGWGGSRLKWYKSATKEDRLNGGGYDGCPSCGSDETTKNI